MMMMIFISSLNLFFNTIFVQTVTIPYSEKVKDGHSYIEYREEDVQDSVYAAVLKQAYRMFQVIS